MCAHFWKTHINQFPEQNPPFYNAFGKVTGRLLGLTSRIGPNIISMR